MVVNNVFASEISYFQNCREGIHFENTSLLDLTGGNLGLQFFDMEDYAIYLEGTDLMAWQVYISGAGNGIWVEEPNNLMIIEEIGCYGYGGKGRGIYTAGTTELQITDGVISDWGTGIYRLSNTANEHTLIDDVNMFNCNHNVWGSVLPSSAEIQFNTMWAVGHNVWLSGIGSGDHTWAIQHNDALRSGMPPPSNPLPVSFLNRNINFSNVNNGRIYLNDSDFNSPFANIRIGGGQYATIGENTPTTIFSNQRNMEIWGSPMADVYCNTMSGANAALQVMNGCMGSEIRANDFSRAWGDFNLLYGSQFNQNAVTSPQDKKGNLFDLSTSSTPKAKHFTNVTGIAEESQYIVGLFEPGPLPPQNQQGNSYYPYFESVFSEWFDKAFNGQDDDNCIQFPNELDKIENAVETGINLLEAGIDTIYGDEVAFDTELKLFRHLERLQELTTLDTEQSTWHASLSATDIADFVEFENVYRTAVGYTDAEKGQAEQLSLDISNLRDEMLAIEWYVIDTINGVDSIDTAARALYESKAAELSLKMDTLTALVDAKQQALYAELSNLASINNGIGTQSTVSGQNLKTVNGLLLQRYDPVFAGFSSGDVTTLTQIADQCVGQGGEAVYHARSLLAEHLNDATVTEYDDECVEELQPRSGGEKGKLKQLATTSLKIMPNPADHIAKVTLPKGHNISSLLLMDAYGRLIKSYELNPEALTLNLNTSELKAGTYSIVPSDKGETPLRFTVIH